MMLHLLFRSLEHVNPVPTRAVAQTTLISHRRLYSDRLYELIERKCLLPEKYLQWLISPYWKNVSLPGSVYSVDGIIGKLRVMGEAIHSLNLQNSSCSPDIVSAIVCCVPNVSQLNLGWTYCTDGLLLLIRKMCSNLFLLDLSNCRNITDAGMKNLCNVHNKDVGFDSLKTLNISRTCVTSQGIAYILKHLKLITLKHESLSLILYKLCLSNSSKKLKLSLTDFEHHRSQVSLQEILETWTGICPDIKHVYIEEKLTENDLKLAEKFEYLTRIKLVNKRDSPKEVKCSPFLTMKGSILTHLDLFNLTVSIEVIARVCHNLKHLLLYSVTFEDFSCSSYKKEIHRLASLESLTVKHVIFSKEPAIKSIYLLIKSGFNLNDICIQYAQNFTDSLADNILRLPYVSVVDFSFTDIKCSTLVRFFTCKKVTKIRADGCPFISEREEYGILKFINDSQYGNTCSWEIDYSEMEKEPLWHSSTWNEENMF